MNDKIYYRGFEQVEAIQYAEDKSNAREVFIFSNGSDHGWDRCLSLGGLGWVPGIWLMKDNDGGLDVLDERELVELIGWHRGKQGWGGDVVQLHTHFVKATHRRPVLSNGWTGPWEDYNE